ncbi:MAG: SpoIID/LytB domain-containing protein [Myxococcota bacterium]
MLPALLRSRLRPRRLVAPVGALVLVLAALTWGGARADDGAELLDMEALYDHRFRFDAVGHPVVTVGLMDGRGEVRLRSGSAFRVRFRDKEGQKTLQLPAGARVGFVVGKSTPARVRRWVVVETLERDDRTTREEARARWEKGGWGETRVFDVGGIYGVEGTVVDNRASLVCILPPPSSSVEHLSKQIYEQTGARGRVHEELLEVPHGTITIRDEGGATLAQARDVAEVTAPGGSVVVEQVEHSAGYKNHGFEDRTYVDRVLVALDSKGKLAVINALDVDRQLAGIVPSEIFPNAHPEALKAQAVTARGEVFAKIGLRHLTDPFLLCDEQHCQVYSGIAAERAGPTAAVEATRGEMAFLGPRLVDSVYSSMCGGRSEDNDVVWEVPPSAALRGRVDYEGGAALQAAAVPALEHDGHVFPAPRMEVDLSKPVAHPGLLAATDLADEAALRRFLDNPPPSWCAQATLGKKDKFRWKRRLTRDEVNKATRELAVGNVVALQVEGRGHSGRVRTLKVVGTTGTAFVHRELPVRRLFGNLPSGLFVIDEERGEGGEVLAWTFSGAGFGHGVGMCQTGAVGMAEAGHDYRAILRHYYNGAEVRRVY